MRRVPSVVLEARHHEVELANRDPYALEAEHISLEEHQLVLDEAHVLASTISLEMFEIERCVEISMALEDLAQIADGIKQATPAEIALIEAAGEIVVAGTDVDPNEVVPAMESYTGGVIATEGIKDTAKKIWSSIAGAVKTVWQKIKDFFFRLRSAIPKTRDGIKSVQKKLSTMQSATLKSKEKVKITTGVANLSIKGVCVKNEKEILKGIQNMSATVDFVVGPYIDMVVKQGQVIATALQEFDPAAPEQAVEMRGALQRIKVPAIPGAGAPNKQMFSGFTTTLGMPLFGNVSLASKQFTDNATDKSPLAALDRVRASRFEFIKSESKEEASTAEMDVMSVASMMQISEAMLRMLDTLEEYVRGSQENTMFDTWMDVYRAGNHATETMYGPTGGHDEVVTNTKHTNPDGSDGPKTTVVVKIPKAKNRPSSHFQGMINFTAAYTRWCETPATPMMEMALRTVSSVTLAMKKSIAMYSKEG